ncbi:endonuclease V [Hydrogenimonas urashimensis]|uniref:endonuclease V n=1 Tax=Hydrogenimonas urashimensis TaxID=2740515 RepID=UPI00191625DC|nr:endonuclease V [Hydrogenimonas urashimensis]
MILAVDVAYRKNRACAAGVAFEAFEEKEPAAFYRSVSPIQSPYVPGAFYRRELPPILHLIERHRLHPDCVVIDGYVFLDGKSRWGLGAYLYEHFHEETAVIGVAKSRFASLPDGYELYRGGSRRPLYITAAGIDLKRAKDAVTSMEGEGRIPKFLKLADRLAKELCERL